ncbi:MAG: glycerol-3-phosphate 1-O-acyltransferase PlsY [Alphaproteobacteria bacterium]|nr:glycerol-3-phosphate 1-O-acyltransferase PlsY [Alphaproteobacteria bacterium]
MTGEEQFTVAFQIGAALLGYLLGSIPFGLFVTRMGGLGDIRAIGSGNIGATNVLRTGRRDLAIATLVLDAGKAALAYGLAVWLAGWAGAEAGITVTAGYRQSIGLVAGAAAFVGHCYPVWLKFKGGKGVATFLGLLLAAMWPVGLAFAGVWIAVAALFRMSSLAALVATLVTPALAYWLNPLGDGWIVMGALALLIIYRHHANIRRILAGTEPRLAATGPSADSG